MTTHLFLGLECTRPNVEKMPSTPALDETAPGDKVLTSNYPNGLSVISTK